MLEVAPPEIVSMATRDGTRLDADIYRPTGSGTFPVLLMRQPYGRRIATTVCYAHPAWYAAQGYVVVIQDVRGRGSSAGTFILFEQEAEDGEDTVAWAAGLPGSTGAVGMYGFSYQGTAQLLAATRLPPALKAIAPAMIGWDLRRDWAYENDAFCLGANLGWAIQLAALEARRAGDTAAFAELAEAARSPAVGRTVQARPSILERHARYVPHYERWLAADADDPCWPRISPATQAATLTGRGPPALFVSGWYDTHLPGTVAAYRAYEAAGATAELIVGPWAHFPWGRRIGGHDFGEAAIGDIDRRQIAWFDRHLKRAGADASSDRPVRLFDIGERAWRDFARWPAGDRPWRIASGGRAALDERDGVLAPVAVGEATSDHLVHDPWRPVRTIGGAFGGVPGPVDRTEADTRPDVLTYTSPPLERPLPLAGEAAAHLIVQADQPSFDVSCVLSIVDADGRSRHLGDGYVHVASASGGPVVVPFKPFCATLLAGERVRLSIAGASFPAYPVNPGTGRSPVDAPVDEAEVITLRLHLGGSRLMLPIVPDGAEG